ncbi:MAG TPA: TetR/AcrR family transcriptional regulator, partial [Solirubrobacterales bacterium]|nr:TetR/AcrR family transcriptional regulator [Solirubrobacterales bacterium]
LRAARDPRLREASQRSIAAYESFAAAALEALGVPQPQRHASGVVALITGMAVRRLGTGSDGGELLADALLTLVAGAESR